MVDAPTTARSLPTPINDDAHLQPHRQSAALVTIDVQKDTLDGGAAEIPGTSSALPAMCQMAHAFREARRPIVHMVRLYLADGSNVDLCRRSAVQAGAQIFLAGSPGSQIADGLTPPGIELDIELLLAGGVQELGPGEVAIFKARWGAFFQTPLQAHLAASQVDTLFFCGANFPNCPRTSIWEASERDYRLAIISDATSGLSQEGIAALENIGVSVWSVAQAEAELGAGVDCSS
jgi:nicotinamidase-related amidase